MIESEKDSTKIAINSIIKSWLMVNFSDGNDTLILFLIKLCELQNEFYRETKDNYARVIFMDYFDGIYEKYTPLSKIVKDIKKELGEIKISSRIINNLSIKIFQNQDLRFNLKGENCKRRRNNGNSGFLCRILCWN